MTNKEKEDYLVYLTLFHSTIFPFEADGKENFFKQMPRILYKYRKFDKYAIEMLKGNNLYFSPITELDDPFDCMIETAMNKEKPEYYIDFIIKKIFSYTSNNGIISERRLKKIILSCLVNENFDTDKFIKKAITEKIIGESKEKTSIKSVKEGINSIVKILCSKGISNFLNTAIHHKEDVGVCSLTANRDNKAMWSLYANKLKGYCVEYEIPDIDEIRYRLLPVLYRRKDDVNISLKVIEYALALILRNATSGEVNEGFGALNEAYAVKNISWSDQDEWRLLGSAKSYCSSLKIKAVYLGFKVSKENERNVSRIAKQIGFYVYKMEPITGNKKISYSLISV